MAPARTGVPAAGRIRGNRSPRADMRGGHAAMTEVPARSRKDGAAAGVRVPKGAEPTATGRAAARAAAADCIPGPAAATVPRAASVSGR